MTHPRSNDVPASWVSALAEALSVPVLPGQSADAASAHSTMAPATPEARWLEATPGAARPAVTATLDER